MELPLRGRLFLQAAGTAHWPHQSHQALHCQALDAECAGKATVPTEQTMKSRCQAHTTTHPIFLKKKKIQVMNFLELAIYIRNI